MSDNEEFNSRQERNGRLRNIDYQLEEEFEENAANRKKSKERKDRLRKREEKKLKTKREERQKQEKQIAEKKAEQKKIQKQTREDMEKIRATKATEKKVKKAIKKAKNENVAPMGGSGTPNKSAKDNITTEIYLNDKKVSEKNLTPDLIKKIKAEQGRAEKELEEQIEKDDLIKKNKDKSQDNVTYDGRKLKKRAKVYTSVPSANGGRGRRSTPKFGSDKQNVPINGNYNNDKSQPDNNNQNNNQNNIPNGMQNNTSQPISNSSGNNNDDNNIDDRERLRLNLAGVAGGVNAARNSGTNKPAISGAQKNSDESPADGADDGTTSSSPQNFNNLAKRVPRTNSGTNGIAGASGPKNTGLSGMSGLTSGNSNNLLSNMPGMASGGLGKIATATSFLKKMFPGKKLLSMGSLLGLAGGILLAIIMVVGLSSFFMNMPGAVRDKVVNFVDTTWQACKGLIVGPINIKANSEEVKNLAEYLERMGFDLEANGFTTILEKDDKGNIKKIESKYLAAYMAAEERNYLIANENHNVKDIWEGVWNINKWDEPWGTGMIVLEQTLLKEACEGINIVLDPIKDMINTIAGWFSDNTGSEGRKQEGLPNLSPLNSRIIIKRDTKEMYISKFDILDVYNQGGYDVYRYSLKEWIEKYGTPMELFLTLHLATKAPEFAYNFAINYDTKVFVNVKELNPDDIEIKIVYVKTDDKNQVVLEDNKPVMVEVKEGDPIVKKNQMTEEQLKEILSINSRKIGSFTPYITKVMNHWYYKQIIYQGSYQTTDGKEHQIDVYKAEELKPGDEGYIRYYAYTRAKNADQQKIAESTEVIPLENKDIIMGLFNIALQAMQMAFTGGFSGISGIMEYATEAALNEGFNMLKDAVVDQISDKIKDVLPSQLAGMLNVDSFLKDGLSLSNLQNLNIDNLGQAIDFNKITESMSLDNLKINAEKLWDELNLKDELMNMDIAGYGSINDLTDVIDNINLDNINQVFSDKFNEITDFANVEFGALTDRLVEGFSSSLADIQDSIVNSCDELFSAVSELDFNTISDRMLGDISKQLSDISAMPILDNLNDSIKQLVDGKFNAQILSGLQNEFAKQLTGLSYSSLSQLANIPNMDFESLKNLSGQVTGVTSALKGAETSITNLTNQVNKAVNNVTGMDTAILSSVSKTVEDVQGKVTSLTNEAKSLKDIVNSQNLTSSQAKDLVQKVEKLENATKLLNSANEKLDLDQVKVLKSEINTCKNDINSITNTLNGIEANTLGKIQNQVSNLENQAQSVINHINSLDTTAITLLKNKIYNLDKNGLINLAMTCSKLDVSNNGLKELVKQYGSDITGLKTSQINFLMNTINGKNIDAQSAIEGISGYLLSSTEGDLRRNLNELNSTVNLLKNATQNLDVNKVANLLDKVPALNDLHLNNIASQLANLQNASVKDLLGKVEEAPKKLVDQVSKNLTNKITEGVKNQISNNLSGKLKNKMLSDKKFSNDLKKGMTSGEKNDINLESKDSGVEGSYTEYSTGFYVRETRHKDYFQKAEPIRILYPSEHWRKIFREDKYVSAKMENINMNKIDDPSYVSKYGKTIWELTNGQVDTKIYAMLQSVQSAGSEYLLRYFKELFTDFPSLLEVKVDVKPTVDPLAIKKGTIGWVFKTAEVEEIINTQTNEIRKVNKAEYEPYTWTASKIGILEPKSKDAIYGFKTGLDIVSPVNGVVVSKTEAKKNELGQSVAESVTIELRNTGDENADGMKIILIGGDFSGLMVGSLLNKKMYKVDNDGNYTGEETQSVIGYTKNEPLKIMVLDKYETLVNDVSEYIYPPYEQYSKIKGEDVIDES